MKDYEDPCARCGNPTIGADLCVTCRLNDAMRSYMPREPRWRYWTGEDGWLYGWSTERFADGKFGAFLFKPTGPGARSGKADRWEKVREIHFAKRSTAKARAAKWFNTRHKREAV